LILAPLRDRPGGAPAISTGLGAVSEHVLAFVDDSRGSDGVVSVAQDLAASTGARLTLVAVAVIEDERQGCCDLRSALWNRMQRELAAEQLRAAAQRLAPGVRATLAVAEGATVEDSLVDESLAGDYVLIVVADERRSLLRRRAPLADRLRGRVACEVTTPTTSRTIAS
jgi:nucleotide-binding universal stress UspA family protein